MDAAVLISKKLDKVFFQLEDGTLVMAGKPHITEINYDAEVGNRFSYPTDTVQYEGNISTKLDLILEPDEAGNIFYVVTNKETDMKYHVDKDGNRTLIAELKDSHLINIINLGIRKLEAARRVMDEMDKPADQRAGLGSSFMKKMYDLPDMGDAGDKAEQILDDMMAVLPYYVFEAIIRAQQPVEDDKMAATATITFDDITNWQKTLQAIFSRKGQISTMSSTKLLGMNREARVLDDDGFVQKDIDPDDAEVLFEELEDIRQVGLSGLEGAHSGDDNLDL